MKKSVTKRGITVRRAKERNKIRMISNVLIEGNNEIEQISESIEEIPDEKPKKRNKNKNVQKQEALEESIDNNEIKNIENE